MTPPAPARDASLPPALVVGGAANALSVARSLGRMGVRVFALAAPSKHVHRSRYVEWIRLGGEEGSPRAWERFLLGEGSEPLRGAVLLLCCDEGLEIAGRHHAQLAERFVLEEANPEARLCVLDKLSTYREAAAAGVPTPRFWEVAGEADLGAIRDELVYPLLLKPRLSHHFERAFRRKYLRAESEGELRAQLREVFAHGIEVVLLEFIPGPDDRLCSYYTYLDAAGEPLFHFTKRILRRYPPHMGGATYHITDWIPEVAELGLKLFRHVKLRGLANVEFKRDGRDGRLKVIECNARFTAGNPLVVASGFDLGAFVYNRLTGRPQAPLREYRRGLRLWSPWEDFLSCLELRARGELTLPAWLWSVLRRQTFPLFAWDDPLPSLATGWERLREAAARRLDRLRWS